MNIHFVDASERTSERASDMLGGGGGGGVPDIIGKHSRRGVFADGGWKLACEIVHPPIDVSRDLPSIGLKGDSESL